MLSLEPCPPEGKQEIFDQLVRYNRAFLPPPTDISRRFTRDGVCVAGVLASCRGDCACVEILWVDEACRGRGLGRALLASVEREGAARGARRLVLDTFAFQAPGFYEKLGFRMFGCVEPYANGYGRYYYVKDLPEEGEGRGPAGGFMRDRHTINKPPP